MNDLNLLLRAVIENPDEDTPRLMYADAIEEREGSGDAERADFIRRQIAGLWTGTKGWVKITDPGLDVWSHRGFLHEITTDAATFLRHADALIWHPTQTRKCPNFECRDGRVCVSSDIYEGNEWGDCPTCHGTGRVPRPCPPTAQPIRRVVLTTWPEGDDIENDGQRYEEAFVSRYRFKGRTVWTTFDDRLPSETLWGAMLRGEWPGVEFVLPRTGNVEEPDPYDPMVTS